MVFYTLQVLQFKWPNDDNRWVPRDTMEDWEKHVWAATHKLPWWERVDREQYAREEVCKMWRRADGRRSLASCFRQIMRSNSHWSFPLPNAFVSVCTVQKTREQRQFEQLQGKTQKQTLVTAPKSGGRSRKRDQRKKKRSPSQNVAAKGNGKGRRRQERVVPVVARKGAQKGAGKGAGKGGKGRGKGKGKGRGKPKKGICHGFRDTGSCPYGDDCKFSHNVAG